MVIALFDSGGGGGDSAAFHEPSPHVITEEEKRLLQGSLIEETDDTVRVRIEGTGGFAGASDYRIISKGGTVEKGGRLEFGDSISGNEAVGQVVRGIDEWDVAPPFEVINLAKSPIGPPPAILVSVEGETWRLDAADKLTYAGKSASSTSTEQTEVTKDENRGREGHGETVNRVLDEARNIGPDWLDEATIGLIVLAVLVLLAPYAELGAAAAEGR